MLGRNLIQAAAGNAAAPEVEWEVDNLSFDGTGQNYFAFNFESSDINLKGVTFKTDGTKMYVVKGSSDNDLEEYNLSTAWDVSTASFVQLKNVFSQESAVEDLVFKPDGTKMYIIGSSTDEVNEYSLSTAWDISTASYSQDFSVAAKDTVPTAIFFRNDGTSNDGKQMYIVGTSSDSVHEYTLSTAWDISTASFSQTFSVASQETAPNGLFFKGDGTIMYVAGTQGDDVNEYALSTAWDISTASFTRAQTLSPAGNPTGVFFKSDGTRMFASDNAKNGIFQYALSTAWNVSTVSYSAPTTENKDVSSEDLTPQDVTFKSDGTKMYVVGNSGNDVSEYNLSSAWAVHTASFSQTFSVASEDTAPQSIAFKDDGSKMYIVGNGGNDVNEYDLSTAWDVSTASYNQNFSVSTQDTGPRGFTFKTDGTKMYVVGTQNDNLYEYDLSTAWDISTASYNQQINLAVRDSDPRDISFKSDGTKMFMLGNFGNRIYQYTLSTAWDISTASNDGNAGLTFYELTPQGMDFKPDGAKLFIVGSSNDTVWAFNIS